MVIGKVVGSIVSTRKNEKLVALFNFSDKEQHDYCVKVDNAKNSSLLLSSDWEKFSGTTSESTQPIVLNNEILKCNLKPFSAYLLKIQ